MFYCKFKQNIINILSNPNFRMNLFSFIAIFLRIIISLLNARFCQATTYPQYDFYPTFQQQTPSFQSQYYGSYSPFANQQDLLNQKQQQLFQQSFFQPQQFPKVNSPFFSGKASPTQLQPKQQQSKDPKFFVPKTQRAQSRRKFNFEETIESNSKTKQLGEFNHFDHVECGILKPVLSNFVSKGKPTPHTKWPWHVQIVIDGNDSDESETYCGGTLVSKNFVLTAAHCYDDLLASKRAKNTQILLNGLNLQSQKQRKQKSLRFRAINVYIHPDYVEAMSDSDAETRKILPGPRNDMALVEINVNDPQIKDLLMPVCLPASGYQLRIGIKCRIMGHGFMSEKDEDTFTMPNELQMADVKISSNTACRNEVDSESIKSKINSDTICIRGPIHPCVGDSGGPLLCKGSNKNAIHGDLADDYTSEQEDDVDEGTDDYEEKKWFLTGVTSFAVSTDENDKCGQFKSAVFGKVAHNIDWIQGIVGNNF